MLLTKKAIQKFGLINRNFFRFYRHFCFASDVDFLFPAGVTLDSDLEAARPTSSGEEELQLQLALVMSKEEHDEEMKRQKGDEVKLQMAIEQSKKEQQVPTPLCEVSNNTNQWKSEVIGVRNRHRCQSGDPRFWDG